MVAGYLATARRMLPELEQGFKLEAIGCPVLLVWGERDRMVSPHGAELVRRALPGARLELLDGVGHCPQLRSPSASWSCSSRSRTPGPRPPDRARRTAPSCGGPFRPQAA